MSDRTGRTLEAQEEPLVEEGSEPAASGTKRQADGRAAERAIAAMLLPEPVPSKKFPYRSYQGELFVRGEGDAAAVDPNDVRQGNVGDCTIIAALMAVALADPGAIERLIRDNGDGSYDVTLYLPKGTGAKRPQVIRVDARLPSFGERPAYAKLGDVGPRGPELWVALIEKAYAAWRGKYHGRGGLEGSTGSELKLFVPDAAVKHSTSGEDPASIAAHLAEALERRWPVTATTRTASKATEGRRLELKIWATHEYAPVAVDPSALTVDLLNPYGGGRLEAVPLADFRTFFSAYTIARPHHAGPG